MKKFTVSKAASKGIVMGKAFIAVQEKLEADTRIIKDSEKDIELAKFKKAVKDSVAEIKVLAEDSEIFAAHLDVAEDAVLADSVETKINDENKNAQLALEEAVAEIVTMFESLDDEYLRERAADIKDVGKRMMCKLKGVKSNPFEGIEEEVIVIAEDLAPSDTANMDFKFIKGFITEAGGVTSHVAIMARSMEIPAFVGVADFRSNITNKDYIILDAIGNEIIVNPDEDTKAEYLKKAEDYKKMKAELESMNDLPATTLDGRTVELFANVGSIADVENAVSRGAEGIGLFRSEFLYMENTKFPTEQEQFDTYKKAIETIKHPMIIRTLDIGGDKELSYYEFDKEENPFLGWRAIRISLDLKDVFKTQLRAILRASAYGDVRIMYPMIISVEEFRAANEVLQECKEELRKDNIPFNDSIQTGIMIETPAGVICAEDLAKEVDFFSIGTNDLTQYLLAVDRGNQKIAKMYNSFHPAVLRAISKVIEAGHKYGKMVGMCGEFASDEKALPILLGMGLDEFSMAATEIAASRYKVRNLKYEDCKELAKAVCSKSTIAEIKALID